MSQKNRENESLLRRGATRRDILRYATAGMGLACLGPLGKGLLGTAYGAPTGNDFFVVVNCYGGHDTLNAVIPIGVQAYYDRRNVGQVGSIAIPPGVELPLTGGPAPTTQYGLHPSLVNLQAMWNAGDLLFVTKVGYPEANLSHFTSQDIYSYGVRDGFAPLGLDESGWIARFAERYAPTSLGAVSIGVGRPLDFLGGSTTPLQADSLATFRYETDGAYPNGQIHRLDTVKAALVSAPTGGLEEDIADAMAQGLDLADQIQAAVSSYQSNVDYGGVNPQPIARYLRDVATLVQYGFDTKLFFTGFGGFDTHALQGADTGTQATLLSRLDAALGAFSEDLKDMGVWDRAVVVVMSEFGRRNYQNASGGSDHGHGLTFLVLGGGVKGGRYGNDITQSDLLQEFLGYEVDFRDVYREVLSTHLGVDPGPVFPEPQPTSTTLGFL